MSLLVTTLLGLGLTGGPAATLDQDEKGFPGLGADRAPVVEIPWNRLYPYDDILAHLEMQRRGAVAANFRDFLTAFDLIAILDADIGDVGAFAFRYLAEGAFICAYDIDHFGLLVLLVVWKHFFNGYKSKIY